jgi:hypothetical protein
MLTAEATRSTGTATTGRRHVPYRTAFETRLDFRDATERVRGQVRAWLRDKNLDVDRFDGRDATVGPDAVVLYAATNSATGWQLRERKTAGATWVSTVAVTRGPGAGAAWVSVNVEAVVKAGGAPVQFAAVPKLVRLLLEDLDAYDGPAHLRARPELVNGSRVEDILDLVCSDARRLPTVVAAPPHGMPFDQWRRLLDEVTRNLPGLASIYLLDPRAAVAFNAGVGTTHWIGPGAIRTYLTDVDPAVQDDAIRHRVLSWRRVEEDPRRASRLLAALPRQLAANSIPRAAAAGLELSRSDFMRGGSIVAHEPDHLIGEFQTKVALLESLLEEADAGARDANATIMRQQDELLDLAGELEVSRDTEERLGNQVRTLRRRLVAAQRHDDAYAPPDGEQVLPKDFGDLLDRFPELAPFVVFTGDRDECLGLDEHARSSTWSQVAWQALLAMRDYARTKQAVGFDGDFRRWCETPPEGARAVSSGKVALGESDSVRNNRRMARLRTLPVPIEVDQSGEVFMGAHVRLGQSSTVAPRMHFHDATTDHGTIFVGYIGRHLENTRTS